MLEKVAAVEIAGALTPEALAVIITALVKEFCRGQEGEVLVFLKEQDKRVLEGAFLSKLKNELKKGIELHSQDDIQSGFVISFDAGRSLFDFTEKSLAQYLGTQVKPKLADILNGKQ